MKLIMILVVVNALILLAWIISGKNEPTYDLSMAEGSFFVENLEFGEAKDLDIDANAVVEPNLDLDANRHIILDGNDLALFDYGRASDIEVSFAGGGSAIVTSKDGVLHFTGDINVFINGLYDYLNNLPIGTHTKLVVFEPVQLKWRATEPSDFTHVDAMETALYEDKSSY